MNVLKAGLIVKHGGDRSKNDYIQIKLTRNVKDIAAFWRFRRKAPKGKGSVALSKIIDTFDVASVLTIKEMMLLHAYCKKMRFPIDVILICIRWYAAYPLSCRHLEEMMEGADKVSFAEQFYALAEQIRLV